MRARLIAVAAGFALALAGCGGDAGSDPAAARTASNGDVFNDADVAFATDMIPHHAQAIEMVVLTQDRQLDPAVAALADQIRDAQAPEVETMVTWLTAWDQEIPETSLDHANAGHDGGHGAHGDDAEHDEGGAHAGMPGMMSPAQMAELREADDADFQALWLSMMIEHHEGAIEMAAAHQQEGAFQPAIKLSRSIERSQTAEIAELEGLLGG